ncbi:hypothetical protein ACWDUI_37035 [Streptosporangium sandarakinum]|uniref:hypothetical protein n=1 Tax=Streptosporangium sandarakinum TaxID=1260955 RepID=UPI0036A0B82B
MRALFARRRRSAAERTALTVDKATSPVCDLDCRDDAAIERARLHATFPSFRQPPFRHLEKQS